MRRIVTCKEKIPVKPYLRIFLRGMFRSWVISVILVGKIKPFCISESTVDTRARTAPGHEATWCPMAATRDQPRDTEPPSTPFTQNKRVPPSAWGQPRSGGTPEPPIRTPVAPRTRREQPGPAPAAWWPCRPCWLGLPGAAGASRLPLQLVCSVLKGL